MSEVSAKENAVPVVDGNQLPADVETDEPDVSGFRSSSAGSRHKKPVAKMSVYAGARFYKMNHKKRGVCLILNYEKFIVSGVKDRTGTQVDRDNLEKTFKDLGFEVIVRDELTYSATIKQVEEVAERDYSDSDCFVMCVLSHGEEGVIFAKDQHYKHDQILSPFTADKCPTLAGKPKMFFLQVCQGKGLDDGLTLSTQLDSGTSYKIPIHADFLVAFSTIPGFFAWRNEVKGSWFIQALVAELQESAEHYDILTILTFVNRRVAIDFESNNKDPSLHAKKQVPYITFKLTRLVKFPFEEAKEASSKAS